MPHPIVSNHFLTLVRTAVSKARDAQSINHAGLRGLVRELFVADLLTPLLPPGFKIGKGQIIDSTGGQSAECDVIVYDRSILTPVLYDEKTGHFPLEACIYAIEVKSVVTSAELDDAIQKGRKLWSLRPMVDGDYRPRPVLFAFGSDLTAKSELDRYLERDPPPYGPPALNPACLSMCVLGRGYHFWHGEARNFRSFSIDQEYLEVLSFLGGVANTLIRHTAHRRGLPFGQYLVPDLPVTIRAV